MANGYWQRPEETQKTFNAFTHDTCEGPFLRTGDLGFVREGNLYVTSRLKDLIIIRGHNYFPHDIEQTVQEGHPAFLQGATAAFSVPNGPDEQLVVVQELRHHKSLSDFEDLTSAIRQAISLEHDLPVYAILLVKAGKVPKTTSGKIQRQLCRELFLSGRLADLHSSINQPNTPESTEWAFTPTILLRASSNERQLLIKNFVKSSLAHSLSIHLSSLKTDRNLNELGIDSLMSAQLTCKIEKAIGVVLPPSTFLQDITIDALARRLQAEFPDQIESLLSGTRWGGIPANEYLLSPNQKAQWFLSQLDPQSPAANVAMTLLIRLPVDISAMKRALNQLINQHPILRTIYEVRSGIPYQRILPSIDISLEYTYVRDLDWEEAKKEIIAISQKPFDLSHPPLFRAHLFERDSTNHLLLLNTHHIAADGWSMHLIFEDFVQFYLGKSGSDPCTNLETPADYISFSHWQNQLLESAEGQRLGEFWENELTGELPNLNLTQRPVGPLLTTPQTGSVTFTISSELTHRLHALAEMEGVTLYVILLAGLQVLLHRYTRQEDLLICTPMAGRIRPEYLKTVGNLTNTVLLRENLGGNPHFRNLLRQVSQTVTAAIDHQLYPFSLLVERLRSHREGSQLPLRQVLFVLQNFKIFDDLNDPLSKIEEHHTDPPQDLSIEPFVIPQPTGQFDLTLEIAENGPTLTGHFEYNCEIFDSGFVDRLASHFQILLEGISISPENRIWQFPLFQPHEQQRILLEWNPTPAQRFNTSSIHELIEHQVDLSPDAIALVSDHTGVTYEELNKRANQVGHYLRLAGIRPDMPVGICIERSIQMVVAILAVLKAGGAYVPLDPNSPKARLAGILQDIRPSLILTTRNLKGVLPEGPCRPLALDESLDEFDRQPVTNLMPSAEPQNLAYVIYTSGSTGRPKGVQIEHQSLVEFALSFRKECELKEGDRVLQFASIAFDASVEEIFPFLISGGTIVLPTEMTLESPERFLSQCRELNITVLDLPTAYWHEIALQLENHRIPLYPSLRLMIIGGEKASPRAVHIWQKNVPPSIRLLNTYGPTEATVTATAYDLNSHPENGVDQSGNIPIGLPLAHIKTYILDHHLQPVPIGIPGELYLGGHSLARRVPRSLQGNRQTFHSKPI